MHEDNSPTEAGRLPEGLGKEALALSLLVMSRTGVLTFSLPSDHTLLIGRSDESDIQLDDPRVSRQHARLHVGRIVEIEDLGGVNGTLLNGLPMESKSRARIDVGDMVTIGTSVLILQVMAGEVAPTRVLSQQAFDERLEEQSRSGATFAILQIRFDKTDLGISVASTQTSLPSVAPQGQRVEAVLRDLLRPQDVMSSHVKGGGYEALLPHTGPEVAEAMAAQLRERYQERGLRIVVGVACYPRDGTSPGKLEAYALESAQRDNDEPPPQSVRDPRQGGVMIELEPYIQRIAAGTINVLVLGETGVGKELTARAIHDRSQRARGPMVCINCAALGESLLESELFGYERGAFTGAVQAKPGLFETANGGSIFLDEVGELPLGLQAKLLRVLEQREVQRIGALRPKAFDVRFIAATNRDLEKQIAAGRFREDLYFRINGVSITIPPLRERLDELEPLALQFVARAAEHVRRAQPPRISSQVLALMKRYAWPGNIRELRNAMERAVLLCPGDLIGLAHVPSEKWAPVVPVGSRGSVPKMEIEEARPTVTSLDEVTRTSLPDFEHLSERERVVAALDACKGNQTHAAKILGVSRRTLITRIEEYGLPRPRKKESESD